MNQVLLSKVKLADFISFLGAERKVVGPVALGDGQFKLAEVTSLDEMSLHQIPTILPAKKYSLPQHETLLKYDISDGQRMAAVIEVEKLVLFGIPGCDLSGIQCLDQVFSTPPCDEHYLIRKKHLSLIGLECNEVCDSFASCALQGDHLPKAGYDLLFSELNEVFIVNIQTVKGAELVEKSQLFQEMNASAAAELVALRELKKKRFKTEWANRAEDFPALFDQTFDSQVWDDLGKRCLACGNCTNVCPTCYCFDVQDEPDLNLITGRRIRVWDSCQNEEFAKVAGGESFRLQRSDRQRHRFHRKFSYPLARYNRLFCTGCGRCSRTCMAGIDLQETIQSLRAELEA